VVHLVLLFLILGAGILGGAIGKAGTLSARTTMIWMFLAALAGSPAGMGQQADLIEFLES
jgi:hypothetical protein